jgi:hypothetical protein
MEGQEQHLQFQGLVSPMQEAAAVVLERQEVWLAQVVLEVVVLVPQRQTETLVL